MPSFDQKFLFVSGKGGVGKTSVSVAIAQNLAANGRRVLLAVSEVESVARLLGRAPSSEIERFEAHLHVVSIDPEVALREYAGMVLGAGAAVAAALDNRYSRSFLKAVPGLYQWAVLGKAWYHCTEEVDGEPRFDTVIFDAPSTGHSLEMLQLPRLIQEAAPAGLLRRDAEKAWLMLQDPTRAGVVIVSLPEDLSVSEGIELTGEVRGLGLTIAAGVINARLPELLPPELSRELTARPGLSEAAQRVMEIAQGRAEQEAEQKLQEARFRTVFVAPVWVLPWLSNVDTPAGARILAGAFDSVP